MLQIGMALLLLSLISFALALKNWRAYKWIPASTPLSLEQGQPTQLSFMADSNFTYEIRLSFEKTIDFHVLDSALSKMQEESVFKTEVLEEGRLLTTDNRSYMGSSSTLSLIPSLFQAQSGQRYTVLITPEKSFPELQVTKPIAQISVDSMIYTPYVIRIHIYVQLAALLFLIGLGLTLAGWWRRH